MRNVFCVWALCAMLFCVAPGLAGAAPQLNEEALRSVVISRLGRVLTENGQDAVARNTSPSGSALSICTPCSSPCITPMAPLSRICRTG